MWFFNRISILGTVNYHRGSVLLDGVNHLDQTCTHIFHQGMMQMARPSVQEGFCMYYN